jgi:hypothetical protein
MSRGHIVKAHFLHPAYEEMQNKLRAGRSS